MRRLILPLVFLTLTAGACSTGGTRLSSVDEVRRIEAECAARGGVVVPGPRITNEPALDNICRINGVAAPRLNSESPRG